MFFFLYLSISRFPALCLPVCLQRPATLISARALLPTSPLSLLRDPYKGSLPSVSLSTFSVLLPLCRFSTLCLLVCLKRPVYSDICSCSFPLFSSLSFERSLCRFSALCRPVCLQRPVYSDICSCSFPLFPPLSFEGSLCRFSALCLPVCLQRCLSDIYPYRACNK